MTKKVLTLLLAMVMLVSLCPFVMAETETITAPTNVAKGVSPVPMGGTRNGTPTNLTDGNLNTRYVGPYGTTQEAPSQIPTITFDLGRYYEIEKIKIYDNESTETYGPTANKITETTTTTTRAQFEIYGSNDNFATSEKLFEINVPSTDSTLESVFPVGGEYTVDLSDAKHVYRYIRYKNKEKGYVNIREIEIYANQTTSENGTVIHPNLYGAEYSAENNEITLSFSEEMLASSINTNSVKLYKSGGTPVSYEKIEASGSSATISLGDTALEGGYYYVEANAEVKNANEKSLKPEEISFAIDIPTVSGLKTAATKLVNVARNKTVTVSDGSGSAALTDGKYQNGNQWVASGIAATDTAAAVAPWATIDLGKRYPIEKIVVFDSGNSVNKTARQQFKIYGSNDPDFNSKEEIYYTNVTENITFKEHKGFVINLSEKPVYRYIRYQGLSLGEVIVREILVYASVTASEIDLTALTDEDMSTTIHNYSSVEGIDRAKAVVDGKALTGTSAWNAGQHASAITGSVYHAFSYDLGEEYPIGIIEVYAGKSVTSSTKHGTQIAIYGSKNGVELYDGTTTVGETTKYYAKLTPAEWVATGQDIIDAGHDVYSNFPANYGGVETTSDTLKWPRFELSDGSFFDPVPFNMTATTEEECLPYQAATITDQTTYRFLTLRKTSPDLFGIDEIKAYVINPEAYSVSVTSNTARIVMNDYNINANTVVKETVKLYDADGNEVEYASVKLDGADIVITFADNMVKGDEYTISVSGIINNQGVEMAAAREFTFVLPDTDYRITNVEAQTSVEEGRNCTVAFDIENEGEAVDLMAVVAIYNGNKLLAIKPVKESVAKGEIKPVRAEVRIAIPEGAQPTAKVFIWNAKTLAPIYDAN